MKKISGILGLLKTIVKYGAFVMAGIEIINFAIDKIQEVTKDQEAKETTDGN